MVVNLSSLAQPSSKEALSLSAKIKVDSQQGTSGSGFFFGGLDIASASSTLDWGHDHHGHHCSSDQEKDKEEGEEEEEENPCAPGSPSGKPLVIALAPVAQPMPQGQQQGQAYFEPSTPYSKGQGEASERSNTTTPAPSSPSCSPSVTAPSVNSSATVDPAAATSDVVQHCLMFPTYATRHSRSGSKDPLDWNVRVRGWAFSKRSNRRKRLVMSMARKIAGVTKDDNKVIETLESRFSMFLASNILGAQFSIQCVGLADTTHMELAGGEDGHHHHHTQNDGHDHDDEEQDADDEGENDHCHSDPSLAVLLDELETTDSTLAAEEAVQDKALFRKSLELIGHEALLLQHPQDRQERAHHHSRHHHHHHQHPHQTPLDSLPPLPPSLSPTPPQLQHASVTALRPHIKEDVRTALAIEQADQQKQKHDARQLLKGRRHGRGGEVEIQSRDLEPVAQKGNLDNSNSNHYSDKAFSASIPQEMLDKKETTVLGSEDEIPLSRLSTAEGAESTLTDRWSKGAAMFRGVYRKYKPVILAQAHYNSSTDSLKLPGSLEKQSAHQNTAISTNTSSNISDLTGATGGAEGEELNGQEDLESHDHHHHHHRTRYEDLGQGLFPTVQVASKLGGHFEGTLRVSHEDVEGHLQRQQQQHQQQGLLEVSQPRFLKLHAHSQDTAEPCHQGIVNLIEPTGISIISDIDDTIKETNVTAGARIILRNTFLKDMQEVEGMAKVYKGWWNQGAAIHYVSNSPWQLIPSLLDFFHRHMFPPGSAHLRLHDSMLKTYFLPPGENKRRCIREILADFPERKFILVGDSGEIDMEVYTEMALEHPEQIFRIFIRDITTARLKEILSKLPPPRTRSFSSLFFSRRGSSASITTNNSTPTTGSGANTPAALAAKVATSTSSSVSSEDLASHSTTSMSSTSCCSSTSPSASSSSSSEDDEQVLHHPSPIKRHPTWFKSLTGLTPSMDPSGPPSLPTTTTSTNTTGVTTPNTTSTGVMAVTQSILGSAFKRSGSPSSSNHGPFPSPALSSPKKKGFWPSSRARSGSVSPGSPLVESTLGMTAYPFPQQQQTATMAVKPLNLLVDGDGAEEEIDMQSSHHHGFTEALRTQQQQQQQHPMAMSTFSTSSSSLTVTPGTESATVVASTTTTTTPSVASSPLVSPSPSSSSSLSSTTKNPLEMWLERIEKCQQRLPEGVLTLFESAHELEQCRLVQDMFLRV